MAMAASASMKSSPGPIRPPIRGSYGTIRGIGRGGEFQVPATGAPVHLEGILMPILRISGRVTDARGEAVPKAAVRFVGSSIMQEVRTDDQGRFQLIGRAGEGEHVLFVTPPAGWKPPDPDPDSGEPRAWTRTFYPGVVFRDLAAPLAPTGVDVGGIDIRLPAVPLHAVRGVLLNADGSPAPKVEVGLWENGPPEAAAYHAVSKANGAFEFPAVPDGSWRLMAESHATLQASEWLEIRGRDSTGWKLRLNGPFTLTGRVILQAREGQTAPPLDLRLLERHAGQDLVNARTHSARPDGEGRFRFEDLYPGAYRIVLVAPPPPSFYLDAVRLGDGPAPPEMELSATSSQLSIVYKRDGGAVRGTVENCGAGMVALVPVDPVLPGELVTRPCVAGPSGAALFEIGGLRPGEYYALAFPGRRVWFGEIDAALLPSATRVTVRTGETTQADLSAVR